MNVSSPARTTFWRLTLLATACLPFLAVWQLLGLARDLNVVVPTSRSWMGLLGLLGMFGGSALVVLALSWSRWQEKILAILEAPSRWRWISVPALVVALAAYPLFLALPFVQALVGGLGWVRALAFWVFALGGMYALKALKKELPWFACLTLGVVLQSSLHLLVTQFSYVSSYPFAKGWSETSRYYYPSLYLSGQIFGGRLPWPILHPSLHLLLLPPYLIDAPLWFHRFWQVFLRFSLLGLTALALLRRLSIKHGAFRTLFWLWMVLYLFQGPVYFHLAVPLILVLWGFSHSDDRRTWLVLILASIWSGLSRINWYPMPGVLVGVLYFLEVPYKGRQGGTWRYLLRPGLWFAVGTGVAFAAQRAYIALSGIPAADFFYTSLTSNLLWYRLLPNASYSMGVLPAALVASLPLWVAVLVALRRGRAGLHPLRLGLVVSALSVLFAGGLVVSMKIGGGVDIHNLDAYLSLLLIVSAYLVFGRYVPETGNARVVDLHWGLLGLIVAVPAWFALQGNVALPSYDAVRTGSILSQLQARVEQVDARDGEILLITQRHLVSMHMLHGVQVVPEYEREELMEMAMGNNEQYLDRFREDIAAQRFDLILVDPLNFRLLGRNYAFGEENNAWAQRVMKPILCNYELDQIYPEDQIALYVPQRGERQCPSLK